MAADADGRNMAGVRKHKQMSHLPHLRPRLNGGLRHLWLCVRPGGNLLAHEPL